MEGGRVLTYLNQDIFVNASNFTNDPKHATTVATEHDIEYSNKNESLYLMYMNVGLLKFIKKAMPNLFWTIQTTDIFFYTQQLTYMKSISFYREQEFVYLINAFP